MWGSWDDGGCHRRHDREGRQGGAGGDRPDARSTPSRHSREDATGERGASRPRGPAPGASGEGRRGMTTDGGGSAVPVTAVLVSQLPPRYLIKGSESVD